MKLVLFFIECKIKIPFPQTMIMKSNKKIKRLFFPNSKNW